MSNYTKATNFTAKDSLPSGNSGKIIKGTELDVEFTAIASAISSKADSNNPTFTGTPTAPTADSGTTSTQIATTAFVQTALAGAFTSGMIMLWSGSIASVPSGWYLCDGNNGTPNLMDRFVVGAGSSYAVGSTGGSKDAIVVAHTHTASTNTTGDHSHTIDLIRGQLQSNASSNTNEGVYGTGNTSTAGAHSHTVTVDSAGSSGTNANLPPYYALAYIMKA